LTTVLYTRLDREILNLTSTLDSHRRDDYTLFGGVVG
jgi:hypothetical protein